jgi:pilus assembly protein CpaE
MSRYVLVGTEHDFEQRFAAAAVGSLAGQTHLWDGAGLPSEPNDVFSVLPNPQLLDAVVLGPGLPTEQALDLAAEFESQRPEVSVLLVAGASTDIVLAAMRAGVRDVVAPIASVRDIAALLHRAVRSATHRRRNVPSAEGQSTDGRVIAVVSPKGGAGKTTVATNLAVGLAAAEQQTVIVDLDLQFGDVASALCLDPEHSLVDAVQPSAQKDSMVLKSYLARHSSGVYALCAPMSPADGDEITAEQVSQLLDQLAGQYAHVIVDTSPGLSEHTLAALDRATDYVFVGGMDVPSIRGLRKELEILRQLGMEPLTRHIVLNAADPRDGLTRRDVESTLGCKVDDVIPNTRAVRISTNQGVPVLENAPRDAAARTLQKVVNRFAPVQTRALQSSARHRRGKS